MLNKKFANSLLSNQKPVLKTFGATESKPLSTANFEEWRKYIYEKCGIYFQDNKKYLLESRLQKRMKHLNLPTYDDYLKYIKFNSNGANEIKYLYEAITINETFFFRNQPQIDALINTILPKLLEEKKKRGDRKLRIWSAASSSGEEAYTTAMAIIELMKPKYPDLQLEIVGTDINFAVVETAMKGIYKEYAVRNTPQFYLKKYFKQEGNTFILDPSLKKYVSFKVMNLYDDFSMRMMRNYDIIFCANVLIYFDQKSKIKVVSHLYNSLNKGGFLFIGYSETLHGISKAFNVVSFPKTIGYMKE